MCIVLTSRRVVGLVDLHCKPNKGSSGVLLVVGLCRRTQLCVCMSWSVCFISQRWLQRGRDRNKREVCCIAPGLASASNTKLQKRLSLPEVTNVLILPKVGMLCRDHRQVQSDLTFAPEPQRQRLVPLPLPGQRSPWLPPRQQGRDGRQ